MNYDEMKYLNRLLELRDRIINFSAFKIDFKIIEGGLNLTQTETKEYLLIIESKIRVLLRKLREGLI